MVPEQPEPGLPASSELVTTSEAAAILRISVTTLRRYVVLEWIRPARRLGRSYLFRRDAVEALRRKLTPG